MAYIKSCTRFIQVPIRPIPATFSVTVCVVLTDVVSLCLPLYVTDATAIKIAIGRVSVKHILLVIGLAAIPIAILIAVASVTYIGKHKEITTVKTTQTVTEKVSGMGRVGTWIKRVQDFIYAKNEEVPYQVQQAKIAIANGGIFVGLGPGNSRQRNFLPHPYSDFIYAIIIEEYGLLGGAIIILIYLVFLFRGIKIFKKCPYAFGAFLALALSFTLVIQALANMAVNVNLVPVTGVTLPLVSMGGSSFLFTCMAIGIILSVARNVEITEGKEPIPQVDHLQPQVVATNEENNLVTSSITSM